MHGPVVYCIYRGQLRRASSMYITFWYQFLHFRLTYSFTHHFFLF